MAATRTNLLVRYQDPGSEFFPDLRQREIIFPQDPMPWPSLAPKPFSPDEKRCDCLQVQARRPDCRYPAVIFHSDAARVRKQDRRGNSTALQASHREQFDIRNWRSEEHTSELQSPDHLVCRLLLEK